MPAVPKTAESPRRAIGPASLGPVEVTPLDAPVNGELTPVLLRVGLATDHEVLTVPCCDPRLELRLGTKTLLIDRPTSIRPDPASSKGGFYRLQVAALKDERQAGRLADDLGRRSSLPADAVFDAETDLYRVRLGRFADREAARAAIGRLEALGVDRSFVVGEGGSLEDPAFLVRHGEEAWRVRGRWLELAGPTELGVPFDGRRFRGTLAIHLNRRGRLNVVNEVSIEDYLRGVVPKEMGPALYNELEALKAQAVAARTYTLHNLGEFVAEGYDICSTPRCQVYGGMEVEHPLSDRAVADTAGEVVLWDGRLAETLYSSTCGGHTENVEVVFPAKQAAWLRGVPCIEAGATRLAGGLLRDGEPLGRLAARLWPPGAGTPAQALASRLDLLAFEAGVEVPNDRLASLELREVLRYLASIFDLTLDRDVLRQLEGGEAADASRTHLAARLAELGDLTARRSLGRDEADALVLALALDLGALEHQPARFLAVGEGHIDLRLDRLPRRLELPTRLATLRRGRASALELMAGDALELYRRRGTLVAIAHNQATRPVKLLDKHAPRRRWTLFKSDADLAASVARRYPGFPFINFQVLERGVSGRAGRVVLIGTGGERLEVEGLAIRWTFDLPDTLFEAERLRHNGRDGWMFRGRGWGHGVGMAQAGAFAMAQRGAGYRDILDHYYTDIDLGRLRPLGPRPRFNDVNPPRSPRDDL
ncbi:MAG: SpoIID/LytB domain-containing protein [Acidobacteriota bacterium]